MPPILDKFGLKDAIEELADSFSNSRKIKINYSINYKNKLLPSQSELHFFRIVQELINNSVRHGKAKNSTINITSKDNKIHFNYTDDGIGFNFNNSLLKKGIGMKNIESRVALLQGKYSIKTAENKGFEININT